VFSSNTLCKYNTQPDHTLLYQTAPCWLSYTVWISATYGIVTTPHPKCCWYRFCISIRKIELHKNPGYANISRHSENLLQIQYPCWIGLIRYLFLIKSELAILKSDEYNLEDLELHKIISYKAQSERLFNAMLQCQ
jgi:hypothetical protein